MSRVHIARGLLLSRRFVFILLKSVHYSTLKGVADNDVSGSRDDGA